MQSLVRLRRAPETRVRARPRKRPAARPAPAVKPARPRRPARKVRRKRPSPPPAAAASPPQLTPDAQQIKGALDELARAQAELTASGIALLNVAHAIGRNAVTAFKDELVASLVQDNLLPDLDRLRAAVPSIPLPADLNLLPEATLNWLCRHLDLSPHLRPGQELEVPSTQLDQYDLQDPLPDPAKPLAKLRIVASGWKRRDRPVIRPRAAMATPIPASEPAPGPDVSGQ